MQVVRRLTGLLWGRAQPSAKRPPRVPRSGHSSGRSSSKSSSGQRRRARLLSDGGTRQPSAAFKHTFSVIVLFVTVVVFLLLSYRVMLNQLDSTADLHPLEVALRERNTQAASSASDRTPVFRGRKGDVQQTIDRVGVAFVDEMYAGHEGVPGEQRGPTDEQTAPPHPRHHRTEAAASHVPLERRSAVDQHSIDVVGAEFADAMRHGHAGQLLGEEDSSVARPLVAKAGAQWVADGRARLSNPALVVFTYNRPTYLRQTLESLTHVAGLKRFSLYVSQDGHDVEVAATARGFGGEGDDAAMGRGKLAPPNTRGFELMQHPRNPLLGPKQPGHAWVAQHYQWALDRLFNDKQHSHVILVEDDMLFAVDFLRYFEASATLLDVDPTLWCVSSWNDNGLRRYAWDNTKMFRTSYFPGLGWMLRKELWDELGPRWPKEQWDHWMRLDTTAKGRECVVPEVNRNFNIGEKGANMEAQTYKKYLSKMMVSSQLLEDYGDLTYLTKPVYEHWITSLVARATPYTDTPTPPEVIIKALKAQGKDTSVILVPYKIENFKRLAEVFDIWPYPRAHHNYASYVHLDASIFIVADARYCPYIPAELKVSASPTLQALRAPRGVDCTTTCSQAGMRCESHEFWFINSCAELSKHFACEQGCALVLGPDIPNYVEEPQLSTFQKCLVTQEEPKCQASHPGTSRLCACT